MTSERKRDGGVEAPAWWVEMAQASKRDLGLRNEDIAAKVQAIMGSGSVDHSRISRCLSGVTATIPLMEAISAILGIPPPVVVAQSAGEAREMFAARSAASTRARILAGADAKLDEIRRDARAGRQTDSVKQAHGAKPGRTDRASDGRRRDPRAS